MTLQRRLTIGDLAEAANVSREDVKAAVRSGELPTNGTLMWAADDAAVERWIANACKKAAVKR